MKLNITKGEWRRFNERIEAWMDMGAYLSQEKIFTICTGGQSKDNTALVCDAANTYQKCGKLPSELLNERVELFTILGEVKGFLSVVEQTDTGFQNYQYAIELQGKIESLTEKL